MTPSTNWTLPFYHEPSSLSNERHPTNTTTAVRCVPRFKPVPATLPSTTTDGWVLKQKSHFQKTAVSVSKLYSPKGCSWFSVFLRSLPKATLSILMTHPPGKTIILRVERNNTRLFLLYAPHPYYWFAPGFCFTAEGDFLNIPIVNCKLVTLQW